MSPTQREAVERLAKWHQAMADEPNRNGAKKEKHAITADLLRELLAEPHYTITWDAQGRRLVNGELAPEHRTAKPAQQPQDEPVAWCCLTPSGKIAYSDGKPMVMPGPVGNEVHRTPLYAHPQQRQPLTREQIDTVWSSLGSFTDRESDYRIFARAIERAHGIKEAP